MCAHLSSVIQFHRGDATHLRQTGGRRRVDIPYFQSDSHAHTHITHARFIRTCVAIKPQKLFFLNGGLPLLPRSFQRGRAAGASANAAITLLECTRVYTHRPRRSPVAGRWRIWKRTGPATEPQFVHFSTLKIFILSPVILPIARWKNKTIFISYIKIFKLSKLYYFFSKLSRILFFNNIYVSLCDKRFIY